MWALRAGGEGRERRACVWLGGGSEGRATMRSPVFGHNNQRGTQTHQIKLQNLPSQSHPEQQLHVNVTFMVMYVRVIVGRRAAHHPPRIIVSVPGDSRTLRRAAPRRESRKKQWVPRREEREERLSSPAQDGGEGVARRGCGALHNVTPHHTTPLFTTLLPPTTPHYYFPLHHTTPLFTTPHYTTIHHTTLHHTTPHYTITSYHTTS